MSKIRLIERDISKKKYRYKYEVIAPAKLFGKRLRKRFNTKKEAKAEKLNLEIHLQNKRLTQLDTDVHLVAARYQKALTVDQMDAALAGAIEFHDQTNKPFKDFADAYLAEVKKNFKRGLVGEIHVNNTEGRTRKLTEWLGNPKIRNITRDVIEEFIDDRLDAGAAPVTVKNYCSCLSAILHRAVDSGVLNRHPMRKIKIPQGAGDVGILTPAEVETLLATASSILENRDEWFAVTDTELQKLVWYKPVVELADDFGISDVAISKRCRKLGIKTPPVGFWAKVKAGKLPHPEGRCEGDGHKLKGDAEGFRINDPANIPAIMIPRLMFGCFAGLRSSEIERLTWEDVRLDLGQLYVQKGKNKNSERWVVLTPPLSEWCEKMLGGGATGLVLQGVASNYINRIQNKLEKAAGIKIPHNALRHSYGSHHLVHHASEGNTAAEMGHHSAQMTFAAYRRAVTKVQAAAYWDIRVEM